MSPNWREISSESFFLQKQLETIDIFTSYKRLFNKSYGQSMYWTQPDRYPYKGRRCDVTKRSPSFAQYR